MNAELEAALAKLVADLGRENVYRVVCVLGRLDGEDLQCAMDYLSHVLGDTSDLNHV